MSDFFGAAIDYANMGTAEGFNIMNTMYSNMLAKEREEQARKENYYYNEKAANMADERTRALYGDLYSPAAQLQQIKDAGLSPSLFYGDGGGIAGQTGAQGAGASGVMGQSFGVPPLEYAQLMKLDAETDQIKAQTRKTNEETATEAGTNERGAAEIEQIVAKTKNTYLQNVFQEYENALSEVQLGIEAATADTHVKNYIKQTEYLEHITTSAKVKASIDEQSEQDILGYIKERTNNLIADTWLKKSQTKLTKQQVLDLVNQITNRDKQIEINENTLKEQVKQWGAQNGLKEQEIDMMMTGVIVHGVVGGASNIIDLLKFAQGLRGTPRVTGL